MAKPGEIEVSRSVFPEEGRCYEHIEATRRVLTYKHPYSVYLYFSSNIPRYIGKFTGRSEWGEGSQKMEDVFDDNGTENRIAHSSEGNTCFIEVPCKLNLMKKAQNQALRNVYETKTGQTATPGHGPANLIRKFAGIKVPKGAEGGMRKRSRRSRRKLKTRKHGK